MKVVLDTNIFMSGIFWIGICNEIINYWKSGRFSLVSSLEIIDEFVKVMKDFKIQLPEDMIKEWVNLIISNSTIVKPEEKINIIKDDPKDNIFIETAVAGNVSYIVSQDKHLLNINEFRGIKIITPEEFLEILKKC